MWELEGRECQTQGHFPPSPKMSTQGGLLWECSGQGCGISLDGLPVPGAEPVEESPTEADFCPNSWNVFEPHKHKRELGSR